MNSIRTWGIWILHYLFWLLLIGAIVAVITLDAADVKAFRYMGF